ncbi:MAG: sigma 54-interacting transcriptional regulator [Acidobacteria bacterium]|nr:sigma 54-interacting transcriptional regulator [Acidobacteriota bacterium]
MAIHRRSARSSGPFGAINCNSIPENLLESGLFGDDNGAFTGANRSAACASRPPPCARPSPTFPEEIGELRPPTTVQVRLQRCSRAWRREAHATRLPLTRTPQAEAEQRWLLTMTKTSEVLVGLLCDSGLLL